MPRFAAVHESESGPKRQDIVPQQNVGLWGQTGSDGRTPEMTLMTHMRHRDGQYEIKMRTIYYSKSDDLDDVYLRTMSQNQPVRITFMRSRLAPRAFLVDTNLDLHSLEELRDWAARKVDFIVVDENSGKDATRVLLA
jgi:hypothetical protein